MFTIFSFSDAETSLRRKCRRKRTSDLETRGFTPNGENVDREVIADVNEVNINGKTAVDNTKFGTQAISKKETSTTTQHIRSTSRPACEISIVALVPCSADTLIMFDSLSGMFIILSDSTSETHINTTTRM